MHTEDWRKSAEWQERKKRVNQFLLEYTEEGEGFKISYITLKYHYYSWCKSIGLTYADFGPADLFHVLDERPSVVHGTGHTIIGMRMKHPVGLPSYYSHGKRKRKRISNKTREVVYAKLRRNGNMCALCGRPILADDRVHIDHIIPVHQGGTDDPSNLRVVHDICNLTKG